MTMTSHPIGTLPMRTLERVPADMVQVWVQFAYTANTPDTFGVLADVFFALSWEIHAQDEWQDVEQAMTRPYADVPFWMGMYIQCVDYAANDWRGVVARLTEVVDKQGRAEYVGWRDFAANRAEQLAQVADQMARLVLSSCEQNGAKLPEYIEQRMLRQLEAGTISVQVQ